MSIQLQKLSLFNENTDMTVNVQKWSKGNALSPAKSSLFAAGRPAFNTNTS
jgi:hypothetical protein